MDNESVRVAVIKAAKRCLEEKGLSKTSLSDVADLAGIELDELKAMYKSKSLLLLAVQGYMVEQLKKDYISRIPDGSSKDVIKFIIRTRCEFVGEYYEQTALFFRKALSGKQPWSQHLDKMIWLLSIEFVSILEKGVRDGEFKSDMDVNLAVRAITSFYLTGIVTIGLRAPTFDTQVVWDFIEPQVDLLMDSLIP